MEKQFENIEDFLADSSFRHWVIHEKEIRSLYWDAWLKANPDKADVLHEAKELVWAMEGNTPEIEEESEDRIWDAIVSNMEDIGSSDSSEPQVPDKVILTEETKPVRTLLSFPSLRIAMILIISGIGAFMVHQAGSLFMETPKSLSEVPEEQWVTKVAEKGEKKRIQLPDGSIVTMNSDSKLTYKSGFGELHRELDLTGEAYFEVSPDSLLPFRVQSKNLRIIALGTSFTISSFPDKSKEEVKLFTGKVSVAQQIEEESLPNTIFLTPGEEAVWSNQDLNKGLFDPEKALLWTKGILHFDETPFQDVVEILERWYGVEITVLGNETSKNKVSGEFSKENLENVLRSIAYTSSFEFQINDKKVMIEMK